MLDESHHELLARTAAMYYEQEMTQDAIAAHLGLSRVKVHRLLKEARAAQIVQFSIAWPIARDPQLEDLLRQRFDLIDALVVKISPAVHTPAIQRVGQLTARYLEGVLQDGQTLAVCLGRTTHAVIRAIRPEFRAQVRVAQAMGSAPFGPQEEDSASLARQMAHKLGGEVLYLTSPMMADSAEAAEVLRRQPDIQRTLDAARAADVALLGIGDLDPASSTFARAGFLGPDELAILRRAGAVGDIGGQIFDIHGALVPCAYNQRVIGITLDELARIPATIAAAAGATKGPAILGALRAGTVTVLCTDDQAATEVLRLEACPSGQPELIPY